MLQVNLRNAAKAGSIIAIDLPLTELARLSDALIQQTTSTTGIAIEADGQASDVKALGLPNDSRFYGELTFQECPGTNLVLVDGQLTGQVALRCQACLQPYVFQLKVDIALACIFDESKIALVPEGYEPFIHPRPEATYAELLEDDLILGLPSFPRHQHSDCKPLENNDLTQPVPVEKVSPFAGLKSLIQNQTASTDE